MRAAATAECESFKRGAPVKVTFRAKPTVPECQNKCDAIKFSLSRRVPQGSPDIGPATHLRKKGAREEALTATADASDAAANNTRCTSRPVRATSVLP